MSDELKKNIALLVPRLNSEVIDAMVVNFNNSFNIRIADNVTDLVFTDVDSFLSIPKALSNKLLYDKLVKNND